MEYLNTIETLLTNHGKLETILESSINGIIEFDMQGRLIDANPAARQILCLENGGLNRHTITELLPPDLLDEIVEKLIYKANDVVLVKRPATTLCRGEERTKYLEIKVISLPLAHQTRLVALIVDKTEVIHAVNNREYFISTLQKLIQDLRIDTREVIYSLARLVEIRDEDTGRHLERVEAYTRTLASAYRNRYASEDARLTDDYVDDMALSSVLHDIGKVGVSDLILRKPAELDEVEFELIKEHTIIAGEALKNHKGKKDYLDMAREISKSHHEKWDGSGYPAGISGGEIPLSARIVAVCDVYDALISKRPYKEAFAHERAVEMIAEERGRHFDPRIVDLFLDVQDEFRKIGREIRD